MAAMIETEKGKLSKEGFLQLIDMMANARAMWTLGTSLGSNSLSDEQNAKILAEGEYSTRRIFLLDKFLTYHEFEAAFVAGYLNGVETYNEYYSIRYQDGSDWYAGK